MTQITYKVPKVDAGNSPKSLPSGPGGSVENLLPTLTDTIKKLHRRGGLNAGGWAQIDKDLVYQVLMRAARIIAPAQAPGHGIGTEVADKPRPSKLGGIGKRYFSQSRYK